MVVVAYSYRDGEYVRLDLDMKLFFSRELTNYEINPYIENISHLVGFILKTDAYLYNLHKLTNLMDISLQTENIEIYKELYKLKSLRVLSAVIMKHFPIDFVIDNITKCKNIQSLTLIVDIDYFPTKITRLKRLSELTLNSNNIKLNDIPNKLIKKNRFLSSLNVDTYIEFLTHKNMIFIINPKYFNCRTIPKHIRIIKFNNEHKMNKMTNLPKNIKVIYTEKIIIHKKIWNLSPTLKKIHTLSINYFNQIKSNKLPYGCVIYDN